MKRSSSGRGKDLRSRDDASAAWDFACFSCNVPTHLAKSKNAHYYYRRHGHTAASRARCCLRLMTNLLTVLPDFDIKPYTHVLPSLEKALISTSDLLTLDALDVAKRAQVPAGEVKKLGDALLDGLRGAPDDGKDSGNDTVSPFKRGNELETRCTISTLDDVLDIKLNGGIHSGCLTEITGER